MPKCKTCGHGKEPPTPAPSLDEKIAKAKIETPEQDKTPESILKQKEEIDAQYEEPLREENPNPMITEESLKIVNEKQEAEDILTAQINKNIAAQNEKHKPKEIIEVVILRCPHCGGKLKMKE